MQIIEIQQANQPLLVVDRWHEQGVFHGFGDRQVDVAVDLAQWEGAYPADLMLTLRQHHSKTIIHLQPSSANPNWHSVREQPPAGDAWIVDYREAGMSGVTVGIRSADCFPVLVRSSAIPVVAAVHCGWRGAESGIFLDTLVLLGRMGAPPKSLEVAIGPGAQSCCYEVGQDVAKQLTRAFTMVQPLMDLPVGAVVEGREGKLYGNLRTLLIAQACFFGVKLPNIVFTKDCTICDQRYFSYRREKETAGRQISFIGTHK